MALDVNKHLTVDLVNKSYKVIDLVQNDSARSITFSLLLNGNKFNLTGLAVRAYSDTNYYKDLTVVNATDGICKLKLDNQMINKSGNIELQLRISDGTVIVTSFIVILKATKSLIDSSSIQSDNRLDALDKALNDVQVLNVKLQGASTDLERKYTTRLTTAENKISILEKEVYGGTNLLKATALKKNMDYIGGRFSISSAVWKISDNTAGTTPHKNRSFRGDCDDTTAYYGIHQAIPLKSNTTYTIQAWILFDYDCGDDEGLVMQFSLKNTDGTISYPHQYFRSSQLTKGKWNLITYTITTGDIIESVIHDTCIQTNKTKFHGYVGDIKVELGSHYTDWSPNPHDLLLWGNPVGSVKMMGSNVNPSETIGGVWERTCQGRKPVGVGEVTDSNGLKKTYAAGETGGELKHKQTEEEGFPHAHGQVVSDENGGIVSGGRTDFTRDNNTGMSVYTQGVQTDSAGGGQPMNIVSPFQAFYFWMRTA